MYVAIDMYPLYQFELNYKEAIPRINWNDFSPANSKLNLQQGKKC